MVSKKNLGAGVDLDPSNITLAIKNQLPEKAQENVPFEFTPDVGVASGVTWTATGLPVGISLDLASGKLTGFPDSMGSFSVTLKGSRPSGESVELVGDIEVIGDPLAKFQWHLNNVAQKTFSSEGGVASEDLGVRAALRAGFTGKGVRVAISDTGVAIAHPGLKANVPGVGSRDYLLDAVGNMYSGDPTPTGAAAAADGNAHGTAVAGVVAESRGKGFGGHGIAPEASLVGFNYILTESQQKFGTDIDQISSYASQPNIDIFNQSWGYDDFAPISMTANYLAQLITGTTVYRNGKGAIYVRAAGNGYLAGRFDINGDYVVLQDGSGNFLSQNANSEAINANPYTLVVGALNSKGKKASYSSPGAAIWVSGLGGEDGSSQPAIISTDMPGCTEGFSHDASKPWLTGANPANPFEWGPDQKTLNPSCDYTSIMNGTSAAAPSVSGLVALILQANPNLSWKDVFYILAKTATQVDAAITDKRCGFDVAGYFNEPKWFTNQAGFHFHNHYGFGRPDALKAIQLAKSFTPTSPALQNTLINQNVNLAIPNLNATGATNAMNVSVPGNPKIFSVLLTVTSSHSVPAELAFELTSPSGTKSVVLSSCNSFVGNDLSGTTLTNTVLRTNAFLDERTDGSWQVRVIDASDVPGVGAAGTHVGNLTNWKLDFYY